MTPTDEALVADLDRAISYIEDARNVRGVPAGTRASCLDALSHLHRAKERLSQPPSGGWPTTDETAKLVTRFAGALAAKLARAEEKYGYTDGWSRGDWEAECRRHLAEHVAKGDPLDVAAYAAFCWHHGWSTSQPPSGGWDDAAVEREEIARIIDPDAWDVRHAFHSAEGRPNAAAYCIERSLQKADAILSRRAALNAAAPRESLSVEKEDE